MNLEFGAAEADLQLGGLSVRHLKIETGASETTLGFSAPNPIPLQSLDLELGAASFTATGLGNANVRHVTVQAGAGHVDLDFGGAWKGDVTVDVTTAIGAVHIHVPRGVLIDNSARVYLGGIENNTDAVPTPAPGSPVYHLHIVGTATLGTIQIDRH
jgi:hypothetical protein